ncbi:MAG: hypothetical protein IPP83_11415 [Flavobacteriales bacterium]|nr:hypothetical protein [Flavobacteriales bacterium]
MANALPASVRAALWSYDPERLDLEQHAERIITNVLNLGTYDALQWLFKVYPRERIAAAVRNPRPGEWNKRSLNYWSLVFDVEPKLAKRF